MYDLIVLGAGPGGYEAAAYAGEMGKKAALIERKYIGGVCLNEGCIPTKTLLYSAKVLKECREAKNYAIRITSPHITSTPLRFNFPSTPFVNSDTISPFRFWIRLKSTSGFFVFIP